MTTKLENHSVPRHYLMISQLSSCVTVAFIATFLDTRYWVVAVGGLVGWIAQPLFVNIVTMIVGGFIPRPPTEEAAQRVWITRVMPAAIICLGIIAVVGVAAVFFRMAPHGMHVAALFTAGLVGASLALSFFFWVPRQP